MFLERLRKKKNLNPPCCDHPNAFFSVRYGGESGEPLLSCGKCHWTLCLQRYFLLTLSARDSLAEAVEYVRWCGDDGVHFLLDTSVLLRNRTPARDVRTCYATVVEGCLFLKMLHAPFVGSAEAAEPAPKAFSSFRSAIESRLDELAHRVETTDRLRVHDDPGVQAVARRALLFLRERFAAAADSYYVALAPFVKRRLRQATNEVLEVNEEDLEEEEDAAAVFARRFEESDFVCGRYSRYSADFDSLHVATLCVLFRNHLPLACDLALGYLGDAACGRYDDYGHRRVDRNLSLPETLELRIRKALEDELQDRRDSTGRTEVSCRRLCDALTRRRGEELADALSSELFETYLSLRSVVRLRLLSEDAKDVDSVFPRFLFADHSDHAAFASAVHHYVRRRQEQKENQRSIDDEDRIVFECKRLFLFVHSNARRARAVRDLCTESLWQKGEAAAADRPFFWSAEMVKRFLVCYPETEVEWTPLKKLLSREGKERGKAVQEAEIFTERTWSNLLPTELPRTTREKWNVLMGTKKTDDV